MMSRRIAELVAFLVLALVMFARPEARSAELRPAVVTKGAFLLSDAPNIIRSGRKVHDLEGYLPMGTVIYLVEPRPIYNHQNDQTETYFSVQSEIGLEGLVREDLFVPLGDERIAVPVGPDKINLYTPSTTSDSRRLLLQFSRNDDVHLELVGEEDPAFYDVILYRHRNTSGLPATERGRLPKSKIEIGDLKLVDPNATSRLLAELPQWTSKTKIEENTIEELAGILTEKIPDEMEGIRALLYDLNSLQCILSASADSKLGFKLFGSGLGFALDAQLKNKDTLYMFETHVLMRGDQATTYTLLRNVICDGTTPERMVRTTFQEGLYSPDKRATIRLKDIAETKSPWIVTLQDKTVATKMIRINGWESYNATYGKLERMVEAGGGYIARLTQADQQILLNFLIQQIAFFEHRSIFIPVGPSG